MTIAYFAIGTTLANMVNVETYFTGLPPHVLPDGVIPLRGGTETQLHSGKYRRDGFPAAARLQWDAPLTRAEFNPFIYALWGDFETNCAPLYVSAIDELGFYSPFSVEAVNPYIGTDYTLSEGGWIRGLQVRLGVATLQSVTKTGDYTVTTSDRLIYVDTSGGTRTMTLFDVASATLNTVYSFVKTSASNTMTLDGHMSQTINGNATKNATALNHRIDIYTDNGTSWTVLNDRV